MYDYLKRAAVDNVFVAEIFFDPQTHTDRGVSFGTVINGLHRAITDGYRDFSIKGSLIMCFLRHLSEESAFNTLEQAKPHLEKLIGIGLDSGEVDNPPSKFEQVYKAAATLGLKPVAHAGEEAGPEYISQALDLLQARRIDHGVQCLKDPKVVERLVREEVPITVCPLSNLKLQVYDRFFGGKKNVVRELLDKKLKVTINSDDPAYFGGYINDNFFWLAENTELTEKEICQICRNAFNATFLSRAEKEHYLREIDQFNIAIGYAVPHRSITIFGSRGPRPGDEAYTRAAGFAKLFASKGFQVVTGGYSGTMEAASLGAAEGHKLASSAVNSPPNIVGILSPQSFCERNPYGNEFLTHPVIVRNLSSRLQSTVLLSEYFLVMGGTIGTITELFLVWNSAVVRPNYCGVPQRIFLLRSAWEKVVMDVVAATGIFPSDVAVLTFVDSAEEVLALVEKDLEERAKNATL